MSSRLALVSGVIVIVELLVIDFDSVGVERGGFFTVQ
jgi:hypothetical protein